VAVEDVTGDDAKFKVVNVAEIGVSVPVLQVLELPEK
jgi:hypothetical protein